VGASGQTKILVDGGGVQSGAGVQFSVLELPTAVLLRAGAGREQQLVTKRQTRYLQTSASIRKKKRTVTESLTVRGQ
jgi:hypothetical protein